MIMSFFSVKNQPALINCIFYILTVWQASQPIFPRWRLGQAHPSSSTHSTASDSTCSTIQAIELWEFQFDRRKPIVANNRTINSSISANVHKTNTMTSILFMYSIYLNSYMHQTISYLLVWCYINKHVRGLIVFYIFEQ